MVILHLAIKTTGIERLSNNLLLQRKRQIEDINKAYGNLSCKCSPVDTMHAKIYRHERMSNVYEPNRRGGIKKSLFGPLSLVMDVTITAGLLTMITRPVVHVDLSRWVHLQRRTIRWRCATAFLRNPAKMLSSHRFVPSLLAFQHEATVCAKYLGQGRPNGCDQEAITSLKIFLASYPPIMSTF